MGTLSKLTRFASEPVMMLGAIHAPVGGSQELIGVHAIFRKRRGAHAHGEQVFAAVQSSSLGGDLRKETYLGPHSLGRMTRHHNHKFVATHAGDIVVLAAVLLQSLRYRSQYFVPLQVTEPVVHLLETVQIAHQYGERAILAFATCDFAIQLQEKRAGVR